ncbi:class I SAM-dependent methyltransferase [Salinicola avicenniae]|uniref:class I SAM-dependent methyltransferase n=1 Tax=Salinicola avicenniae TaxID=2916836 RepID=UPI0020740EB3|nr:MULTISPECIES: class I SAM-dependent methyltransferase [unclassified Salinicola]
MSPNTRSTTAGQAIYTRRNLRLYDLLVVHASNRLLWRCPATVLLADYQRHVSGNHLDIGVGTGYFLDRCRFPVPQPRLHLLDLNADSLAHTARRVARYRPTSHRADILAGPVLPDEAPFRSIAMNYLLHCLPGPMREKARAFDPLRPLMTPDSVLFGATILSEGVTRSALAKQVMAQYNARGIFDNASDDLTTLQAALHERFHHVEVAVTGCVARFAVSTWR